MQDDKPAADPVIDAGCQILYERIAGAFEPEWRSLIQRMYHAMDNCGSDHDLDVNAARRKRAEAVLRNCKNCGCKECVNIRNELIASFVERLRDE